ncbi:hypothetical protein LRHMDP2_214 [Lacticaseibacillus rhamnosus LRHMDP2]|nr:hypothetical protein LRHMDP2_214 [Lacticaseibacillus rhamnosus LRHMDP2]
MKKSRGLTKTADDFENVSSLDTQYGIKKRLHRNDGRRFFEGFRNDLKIF